MMRNATGKKTTQESLQNCFFPGQSSSFIKCRDVLFSGFAMYICFVKTCYILTVYTYIYIFKIYIYIICIYILYVYKHIHIYIRIHILVKLFNLEMMTSPAQLIDICNITLQQFSWANHHFCLTPSGLGGDIFLDDLTILSLPFHHKTDIHHKHWEKLWKTIYWVNS